MATSRSDTLPATIAGASLPGATTSDESSAPTAVNAPAVHMLLPVKAKK